MTETSRYVKGILERGRVEARQDGSPAVEAEHLLLAIAAHRGTPTQPVLAAAGLDRDAIRVALDREFAASLRVAGVELSDFNLPPATADPDRHVDLGTSAKLVLERAVRLAGRGPGRIRPAHLLLGVLEAEVGTVPRALALAGIDRTELAARTRTGASTQDGAASPQEAAARLPEGEETTGTGEGEDTR
jgi:ATP-dependent Clp protease ATP-binding subunit ClpA